MKAVISIILFLFLHVNVKGQWTRSSNRDSVTVCVDSMIYKYMENSYDSVEYLEINQNRWSKEKCAIISDSITFLKNLKTLYIVTKQSLLFTDSIYKLKRLKEVFIATSIIKPTDLSFYNSKDSLENLRILNYGSNIVLLKNVSQYSKLKTLIISEECKKVKDKKRIIEFFTQLNFLNLEGFKLALPNISTKELKNLNKELSERNLKYHITGGNPSYKKK